MELTLLLSLPAVAALIWPFALLLKKETVSMAQYMMAIGQVLSSCSLIFYISYYHDLISSHIVSDLLYKLCMIFLLPTYYMFICALTSKTGVTRGNRMFFVPSLIMILIIAVLLMVLGPVRYDYYMNNVIENGDFELLPSTAYKLMVIIGYFGFKAFILCQYVWFVSKSIPRMHKYNQELSQYISASEGIEKKHMNITIWIVISIVILMMLVPYKVVESYLGFTYLAVLIMTAVQLLIGHYAYHITYTADQFDRITESKNQSQNSIEL